MCVYHKSQLVAVFVILALLFISMVEGTSNIDARIASNIDAHVTKNDKIINPRAN